MAQLTISLLSLIITATFLVLLPRPITGLNDSTTTTIKAKEYVEAQCEGTQFPITCVQSLTLYVKKTPKSPQELAHIALRVSLFKARSAMAYMKFVVEQVNKTSSNRPDVYLAVKECYNQISDGVYQLHMSLGEIEKIDRGGKAGFMWHMSNIDSWISSAWTETSTCVDNFPSRAMGGKVKATIRAKVVNVGESISNAQALFNRFVSKHRVTGAEAKP
ncbi:21 kDa protein-like [Impatiens glandulifera]|uniref:21 kDa protein-like n=1 Tax=Impatiens glandulifera TaxID=253017 RepID=UPI001FB16FEB|nr:21 kDa protein-like [Impatiens glandulifera]